MVKRTLHIRIFLQRQHVSDVSLAGIFLMCGDSSISLQRMFFLRSIVAIPRQVPTGLFGDELEVDRGFCAVVNQWPAVKGRPTGKYTQRQLPEGIALDLFVADADNWGLQLAIRTGSWQFSKYLLDTCCKRTEYWSKDGRLPILAKVPVTSTAS
jgi:hypothetical protein